VVFKVHDQSHPGGYQRAQYSEMQKKRASQTFHAGKSSIGSIKKSAKTGKGEIKMAKKRINPAKR
jgi:hypothetical protein